VGKSDFFSGFTLLIFGVAIFIGSMGYPFGEIDNPGAGFVPRIASLLLIVISLSIMIVAYQKSFAGKGSTAHGRFFSTRDGPKRIILACAFLLAYRLSFPILGFILTNFLFFLLVTRFLGDFRWRISFAFSFLSTFMAYLLFQGFLKIQMPPGIFRI
jgi:hypothetical protein